MADLQEAPAPVAPELTDGFVKMVAESAGISTISDDCANELAAEMTYRIKDLVQQADKFRKKGKRRKLLSSDLDRALRLRNLEPLYGFTSVDSLPFRFAGAGGRELYFHEDSNLDLTQLLNSNLPKAPLEPQLKTHWLAVDGVQPAVPENPVAESSHSSDERAGPERSSAEQRHAHALRRSEMVQVRSASTHQLSVEQQVYFKEVTEACVGSDEEKRAEALHSLESDTGLQSVLPRIILFLCEGVKCNVVQHNLALLIYLMRALKSLVDNPAVNLEKYIHELVPSVLSCVLSRMLCARPEQDNHWALRDFASRLLGTLVKRYGTSVPDLQARVTEVLAGGWNNEHGSLAMLYGALHSLAELGNEPIKTFVVPRTPQVATKIRDTMNGTTYSSYTEKGAAEQLQKLLVKKLVHYVRTCRPTDLQDLQDFNNQFGSLGAQVFQQLSSGPPSGSVRHSSSSSRPSTPAYIQAPRTPFSAGPKMFRSEAPMSFRSRAPPPYQMNNYGAQISPTGSGSFAMRSVRMHQGYSRSTGSPASTRTNSPSSIKEEHL